MNHSLVLTEKLFENIFLLNLRKTDFAPTYFYL